MENKEQIGSAEPRARYVWDPNKLAWVETVEKPSAEEPSQEEAVVEAAREEDLREVTAESSTVEDVAEASDLEYRGALLRLAAIVIDLIVLTIISFIVGRLPGVADYEVLGIPLPSWIMLAAGFAYFAGFWAWRGQTPGKIIIGARIVKADGSPISFRDILLRYLFYLVPSFAPILFFAAAIPLVSLLLPIIALSIIALSSTKRGPHDMIAGTVVINSRATALVDYTDEEEYEYEEEEAGTSDER